jgi:hypothetical protein
MQPEQIIGQLLGTLVGRKRSRRRPGLPGMMTGGSGRGSLLTGGTLLTAAGLVWGALETMQKSTVATGGSSQGTGPGAPPPPGRGRGVMGGAGDSDRTPGAVVPPPLPGHATPATPPPLPTAVPPSPPSAAEPGSAAAVGSLLPMLQLAISAARADGELSADEQRDIRLRAEELGVAGEVGRALTERQPVESIVGAFTTTEQRRAAYALAFGVIRGDGVIAPGERMYLTQLGRLLRLPPEDIETIERETLGEE